MKLVRMCGGGVPREPWLTLRRVEGAVVHDRLGLALAWAWPSSPYVGARLVCRLRGHRIVKSITKAHLTDFTLDGPVLSVEESHFYCRRCQRRAPADLQRLPRAALVRGWS